MERENIYNQNATFFNPNWDNSMDQNDPFESALSSMVSSPGTSNIAITPSNENFVLRELIGRLGSICNSAEVSPHSYINGNTSTSTNTSCYTTPLNSPPKLHLSPMDHQIRGNSLFPGNNIPPLSFPERRFSNFPNSEVNNSGKVSKIHGSGSQMNVQENSRLSRSSTPEKAENSSVSEQIPVNVQTDTNSRKRKSISKGKAKDIPSSTRKDANAEAENNEETAKRTKSDDQITPNNSAGEVKKDNEKPPESPKDYIHVRARRGQATDAHSLAERVRREKISQRMQLLQDLVPGCNKVTGKAVMLDEIINYVQSLQRQVEFLSMKLATINPRMDVNLEALISKDMFQSRGGYASDISSSAYPFVFQSQSLIPNGTYNEGAPQVSTSFWEDDLQSVVFGQNQAQNFHDGSVNLSTSQMKVEL